VINFQIPSNRQLILAHVCALNGKFSKVLWIKESPEGVSPLCAGVTPGSISKSQGGLGWPMHWSKRDYKSLNWPQYAITFAKASVIKESYGAGEQERDKRHDCMGKQPHHCKALWIPKYSYVDSAGLDRRTFIRLAERSHQPRVGYDEKSAEACPVALVYQGHSIVL